jgi:hypothetical protein
MTTHYGRDALSILTNNIPSFEEMGEGEQGKFNHVDCPNGVDNRQRLYVKNVDGAYLGHCHNCGDSLYYRPKETVSRIRSVSASAITIRAVVEYKDLTKELDYDKFRVEGQLWLGQYGFNKTYTSSCRIAEIEKGVVLPVFYNTSIVGYQVRQYTGKPKYLTYSKQRFSYIDCISGMLEKPLVVVEDLLSSYKLRLAGYPTLCLLGTKLDSQAMKVVQMFRTKRVVLWLDDDTAGHAAAKKLFVDLSPVVPNVTAMFTQQPKEIDMSVLKDMEL